MILEHFLLIILLRFSTVFKLGKIPGDERISMTYFENSACCKKLFLLNCIHKYNSCRVKMNVAVFLTFLIDENILRDVEISNAALGRRQEYH